MDMQFGLTTSVVKTLLHLPPKGMFGAPFTRGGRNERVNLKQNHRDAFIKKGSMTNNTVKVVNHTRLTFFLPFVFVAPDSRQPVRSSVGK